jgi:hypothetical protein
VPHTFDTLTDSGVAGTGFTSYVGIFDCTRCDERFARPLTDDEIDHAIATLRSTD